MNLRYPQYAAVFMTCLKVGLLLCLGTIGWAEDGYRLWLRYEPLPAAARQRYRPQVTSVIVQGNAATLNVLREELVTGCSGLLNSTIATAEAVGNAGAIVVGTPKSSPLIANLKLKLAPLGAEGFVIRSLKINGRAATVIASESEIGALYGAFHFLRLLQTGQPLTQQFPVKR